MWEKNELTDIKINLRRKTEKELFSSSSFSFLLSVEEFQSVGRTVGKKSESPFSTFPSPIVSPTFRGGGGEEEEEVFVLAKVVLGFSLLMG